MLSRLVYEFLHEEEAAEVTELALVLAFIVAAAVAIIATIGQTVLSFFESADNTLP